MIHHIIERTNRFEGDIAWRVVSTDGVRQVFSPPYQTTSEFSLTPASISNELMSINEKELAR